MLSAYRLSFDLLTLADKLANIILVTSLPEYQELVRISAHECIPIIGWLMLIGLVDT